MIIQENPNTETTTREESPSQPVDQQTKEAQERAWQLEAAQRAVFVDLFNPCGLP